MKRPDEIKIDWVAIDAKTDEDIRRAIAEDPDAAPEYQPGEMKRLIREGKARIVRPVKKSLS